MLALIITVAFFLRLSNGARFLKVKMSDVSANITVVIFGVSKGGPFWKPYAGQGVGGGWDLAVFIVGTEEQELSCLHVHPEDGSYNIWWSIIFSIRYGGVFPKGEVHGFRERTKGKERHARARSAFCARIWLPLECSARGWEGFWIFARERERARAAVVSRRLARPASKAPGETRWDMYVQ